MCAKRLNIRKQLLLLIHKLIKNLCRIVESKNSQAQSIDITFKLEHHHGYDSVIDKFSHKSKSTLTSNNVSAGVKCAVTPKEFLEKRVSLPSLMRVK